MTPDLARIRAIAFASSQGSGAWAAGQAGIRKLLRAALDQESPRQAATLEAEHAALRALFTDAAKHPLPEAVRARLVDAPLTEMKSALILLHEAVETIPDDWARDLEERIWAILRLGADRRQIEIPGF